MEKIIFELTVWEIIAFAILILITCILFLAALNLSFSYEFDEVPFIRRWFTGRGNLYKTGYNDALKDKTINQYRLKRDRKIKRLENRIYRAQNQYCELYLQFEKVKFQKENE